MGPQRQESTPSARTRGRPRAEPIDVQRRRVLDAARTAIVAAGYQSLSITEVAIAASVSRATVHELFRNRTGLAMAVIDDVLAELIRAVDEHYAGPIDPDEDLGALIRRDVRWFVEALSADPAIMVCLELSRWIGREAEVEVGLARDRIEEHIASLHRVRLRPLGVERDPSARLLAVCVMAIVESSARRMLRDEWPRDAGTDLVSEFIVGGYNAVEPSPAITRFDEPPTKRRRAARRNTP